MLWANFMSWSKLVKNEFNKLSSPWRLSNTDFAVLALCNLRYHAFWPDLLKAVHCYLPFFLYCTDCVDWLHRQVTHVVTWGPVLRMPHEDRILEASLMEVQQPSQSVQDSLLSGATGSSRKPCFLFEPELASDANRSNSVLTNTHNRWAQPHPIL